MADITLTDGIRDNLRSLQRTAALQEAATRAVSTGRRVQSASDDPVRYFQARSLSNTVTDLTETRGAIGQGISTINAALDGAQGVDSLLRQMKGVAVAARSATTDEARATLAEQYNGLRGQVDALARDAGYQGVNLLSGSSAALTVGVGTGSSAVTVQPRDLSASGLGIAAVPSNGSGFTTAVVDELNAAIAQVRTAQSSLAGGLQTLSVRADYTRTSINTASVGEAKLTQADPNEEAARLMALRTRRQLGQTSLSIANRSQRSLLALF